MYGKFFASTFTGSMCGAGPTVFAVWGYVIANTVDSTVELNPKLLASIIGAPEPAIVQAIKELCEPDPLSRNPTNEGRRLEREGQFQYRVTSHAIYRAMQNPDGLREYNRQKQRESRKKRAAVKQNVIDSQEMSIHTEAYAEAEANTEREKSVSLALSKQARGTGNGNGRVVIDDALGDRVRAFVERYPVIYAKARNGARYLVKQARDFDAFVNLVNTYGTPPNDARLDLLLEVFLKMPAKTANNVPGTPNQFLNMIPECDRLLRDNGR